jgi:RHS repeat-associated protein
MRIPSATRGLRPFVSLRGLCGNWLNAGVCIFAYGAANRLIAVSYAYNSLGQRVGQTADGVTTEYVLDVAGGLPEVIVATTGGASTRYVQVQGQVLGQEESEAWAYILPDHLGSVRQLVGSDSQMDLAQSYDPFGGSFESAGSGASEFGYTGEWWDAEAVLLYLRARYYDPVVGWFVSKDPWQGDSSRPQSLNAWSYVQGNPLNFTDPSGRIFCPYGVDPETGACNPPRWGGSGEGLPPTFAQTLAQTVAVDPASATAQVALSVLAYLYFRLADNPQPGPPPLRVGSPWEGLREWLPLGQQPSSFIPGPALGDTPEWLPAVLPGPYVDMPGTTPWLLDFRLVQPCAEDYFLLSKTKVGITRDNVGYFKTLLKKYPDILGEDSKAELKAGRMPFVDRNWIKYYPEHEPYLGDKLTVHHVEGWIEKPIPRSLHPGHHRPGGYRYNPGGNP